MLALGGGAVLDPTTRARLAGHRVVFLRVGLSEAVKRVGLGTSRPMLLGNVRARIKALLDERTPDLRVGRHRVGRHRRTHARGGRRRDRAAGDGPVTATVDPRRRRVAVRRRGRPRAARPPARDARRGPGAGGARARRGPRRRGTPGPHRPVGVRGAAPPGARRRGGQDGRGGCAVLGVPRPGGLHAFRRGGHARGRVDDRPGRFRGRDVAARRPGRAPPDDPAGHGRRRRRRQDRHQHRRGQEPGRLVPRTGGRAVRPGARSTRCPARSSSPASPRSSSAASSPTPRSSTSSSPRTRPR